MNEVVDRLWGPPVALTTRGGAALIVTTAISLSLDPARQRVLVMLMRANATHDRVIDCGVFALHLLPPGERGLEIVRALGLASGPGKLGAFETREGVTGSPILADSVGWAEVQASEAISLDDVTLVVGDVVASEGRLDVPILSAEDVRELAESDPRRPR